MESLQEARGGEARGIMKAWSKALRLRGGSRDGVDAEGNAAVGAFKWRISLNVKSAEDLPDTGSSSTVVFVWSRGNKTCMSKPTDVDELSRCDGGGRFHSGRFACPRANWSGSRNICVCVLCMSRRASHSQFRRNMKIERARRRVLNFAPANEHTGSCTSTRRCSSWPQSVS